MGDNAFVATRFLHFAKLLRKYRDLLNGKYLNWLFLRLRFPRIDRHRHHHHRGRQMHLLDSLQMQKNMMCAVLMCLRECVGGNCVPPFFFSQVVQSQIGNGIESEAGETNNDSLFLFSRIEGSSTSALFSFRSSFLSIQ